MSTNSASGDGMPSTRAYSAQNPPSEANQDAPVDNASSAIAFKSPSQKQPQRPVFWRQRRIECGAGSPIPVVYQGKYRAGAAGLWKKEPAESLSSKLEEELTTACAPTEVPTGTAMEVVTGPRTEAGAREEVGTCIWCHNPISADEDEDCNNPSAKLLQLALRLHPACVVPWEEEQHATSTTATQMKVTMSVKNASSSLSQASLDGHGQSASSQAKVMQYLESTSMMTPHFGTNPAPVQDAQAKPQRDSPQRKQERAKGSISKKTNTVQVVPTLSLANADSE